MPSNRPILLIAYACNPRKVSEHYVGWSTLLEIAQSNSNRRLYVFTRRSNEPDIVGETNLPENVKFVYFDLPRPVMRIKRRFNLTRLYYYFWSVFGAVYLYSKFKNCKFLVIHHITFVCDWLPSAAYLLAIKNFFIFGPINSNPVLFKKSITSFVSESVKLFMRNLDPFVQLSYRTSNLTIYSNDIAKKAARRSRDSVYYPSIGVDNYISADTSANNTDTMKFYTSGRLVSIKRIDLIIRAFAELQSAVGVPVELTIIGSGPCEVELRRLVDSLGLIRNVLFLPFMSRSNYLQEIEKFDICVFASYEMGGLVQLEALAKSKIVVTSDRGILANHRQELKFVEFFNDDSSEIVCNLAHSMSKAIGLSASSNKLENSFVPSNFLWPNRVQFFNNLYEELNK